MDRTLSELIAAVEAGTISRLEAWEEIAGRSRKAPASESVRDLQVERVEAEDAESLDHLCGKLIARVAELEKVACSSEFCSVSPVEHARTGSCPGEQGELTRLRERVAAFESIVRSLQRWSTELDGDPGDYIAQRLNALVPEDD